MYEGFNGIPVSYDYKNKYNSGSNPSTVHAKNSGLSWYFKRYLIEKVISVFEWDGIPDTWAKDYFFYTLYLAGNVAIINTDKYGVIPQHCGLRGYDVFYRPTNAVIANPLLRGILEPRIGTECALIKMQPDYCGIYDLIDYYADQMALCAESLGVNLVNSKLAYVFAAGSKSAAESLKKLYDDVASGEPAVFADKKLFDADGRPTWDYFSQNLQQNYIAGQILLDMAKIDNRFDTDIGITNVNITKTSGVSNSEIAANNNATRSKAVVWLETMQEGIDVANRLFGLSLGVDLRFKEEVRADDQESNANDLGAVAV